LEHLKHSDRDEGRVHDSEATELRGELGAVERDDPFVVQAELTEVRVLIDCFD
jgi:hypothetical protein